MVVLEPAAEAITLRLAGVVPGKEGGGRWSFGPEFTHQMFEEEALPPGYPDLRVE